jgi:hypothetical protein
MNFLCVLRNDDDLCFTKSLTKIAIIGSKLNEGDLEILMLDIRERFPNLRRINVRANNIKSLVGIEDRIKKIRSSSSSSSSSRLVLSNNNLNELNLRDNHSILDCAISQTNWFYSDTGTLFTTKDRKEMSKGKSALLTLLNTFNGISNLCYSPLSSYHSDVEYALRINHAGRTFISNGEISSGTTATSTAPVINNALWPLILERAYKKSEAIFYFDPSWITNVEIEGSKCATGLFDLVRHYWPMFTNRRCCARWDDNINNDNNSCNDNDNRQTNTTAALNCKRKRK